MSLGGNALGWSHRTRGRIASAMNRLVGCCVALFLFGCVTRGLREHDLEAHGLTALVLEPGQELDWPDVAGLGPAMRIDPAPGLGAAVLVYSPERAGAQGRTDELARWLIAEARLPPERVYVHSTQDATAQRLQASVTHAATVTGRKGALILVFIGDGLSNPTTRQERFELGEGQYLTQGSVNRSAVARAPLDANPRRMGRMLELWAEHPGGVGDRNSSPDVHPEHQ